MDITQYDSVAREKTMRLVSILERVADHPYLGSQVCLHGGTALNLFILGLPRLSLDADFNYIGSPERSVMYEAKPLISKALNQIAAESGYRLIPGSEEHSGTTYKLQYESEVTGRPDFVKIDMDYLNRVPLLPIQHCAPAFPEGSSLGIPLNASIELAAGKVKALLERTVPRDLYDVGTLARNAKLYSTGDEDLDRKIMLFYWSLSAPFPREITIDERFAGKEKDVEENLHPVLSRTDRPTLHDLVERAELFVTNVMLPAGSDESDYLARMEEAEYCPELLFGDYPDVLLAAKVHPAMQWKVKNLAKLKRPRTAQPGNHRKDD